MTEKDATKTTPADGIDPAALHRTPIADFSFPSFDESPLLQTDPALSSFAPSSSSSFLTSPSPKQISESFFDSHDLNIFSNSNLDNFNDAVSNDLSGANGKNLEGFVQNSDEDSEGSSFDGEFPFTVLRTAGMSSGVNINQPLDTDDDEEEDESFDGSMSSEDLSDNNSVSLVRPVPVIYQHSHTYKFELPLLDWENYPLSEKNEKIRLYLLNSWMDRVGSVESTSLDTCENTEALSLDYGFREGEIVWAQIPHPRTTDGIISQSSSENPIVWPVQILHRWISPSQFPKIPPQKRPPEWFEIFNNIFRNKEYSVPSVESPTSSRPPAILPQQYSYLVRALPQNSLTIPDGETIANILESLSGDTHMTSASIDQTEKIEEPAIDDENANEPKLQSAVSHFICQHGELMPFVLNIAPDLIVSDLLFNRAIVQAIDVLSGWATFESDIYEEEQKVERIAVDQKLSELRKLKLSMFSNSLSPSQKRKDLESEAVVEMISKRVKVDGGDVTMSDAVNEKLGLPKEEETPSEQVKEDDLTVLVGTAAKASSEVTHIPLRRVRFGTEIIKIGDMIRLAPRRQYFTAKPEVGISQESGDAPNEEQEPRNAGAIVADSEVVESDLKSTEEKANDMVEGSEMDKTSKLTDVSEDVNKAAAPMTMNDAMFGSDDDSEDSDDEYVDAPKHFIAQVDEYLKVTSMELVRPRLPTNRTPSGLPQRIPVNSDDSDSEDEAEIVNEHITRRLKVFGKNGRSWVKVTGTLYFRNQTTHVDGVWVDTKQSTTVDLSQDVAGRFYMDFPYSGEYRLNFEKDRWTRFSGAEQFGIVIDLLTYDAYADYLGEILLLPGNGLPVLGEAPFDTTDFQSVELRQKDRRMKFINELMNETN
ncbi:hypothetical protein HK098_005107 [Nowakowskiella sp. JEL0407]|nr:hypothetical protein HK098_005107 [Nowakowskiella sp. JEL0407]